VSCFILLSSEYEGERPVLFLAI